MVDKALHSLALSVKEAFDSEEDLKKKKEEQGTSASPDGISDNPEMMTMLLESRRAIQEDLATKLRYWKKEVELRKGAFWKAHQTFKWFGFELEKSISNYY